MKKNCFLSRFHLFTIGTIQCFFLIFFLFCIIRRKFDCFFSFHLTFNLITIIIICVVCFSFESFSSFQLNFSFPHFSSWSLPYLFFYINPLGNSLPFFCSLPPLPPTTTKEKQIGKTSKNFLFLPLNANWWINYQ